MAAAQDFTPAALAALDADDPLANYRHRFDLPEGVIYLDGNSLGALPKAVGERLADTIARQWGGDLIGSWNKHGWVDLPRRVGSKIAPPIGAQPDEVIVADSTSINLFKLLAGALRLRPERHVMVSDSDNFPTDLYVAQGLNGLLGERYDLRVAAADDVPAAIDGNTAVVMLTEVNYRTGARYDMRALTERAHANGALMLWDLAHSAGALPVQLNACAVDFAVGCGYKYLNGGPGAPAFLFIAYRHQQSIRPALSGWFGHAAPFDFDPIYVPMPDLRRMLCGTPPVLSLAALDAALDVFAGVDMQALWNKSLALTQCFIELADSECAGLGLMLATPLDADKRGSQVCFLHPHAYPVMQALIERGVIGDVRAPDILRFGITPLYTRFVDVGEAVLRLKEVLTTERWREPRFIQRGAVT